MVCLGSRIAQLHGKLTKNNVNRKQISQNLSKKSYIYGRWPVKSAVVFSPRRIGVPMGGGPWAAWLAASARCASPLWGVWVWRVFICHRIAPKGLKHSGKHEVAGG